VRELRRVLLAAAPASLSASNALRITGPQVRRLRIELRLRTETLDHAGAIARDVKAKLVAFFDTAAGGTEHEGWPLGVSPSEDDIALSLIDIFHLEGILSVTLREVAGEDDLRAWPSVLKRTDLVILDEDPVRLEFETAEVLA